jgi:hypothetical protein
MLVNRLELRLKRRAASKNDAASSILVVIYAWNPINHILSAIRSLSGPNFRLRAGSKPLKESGISVMKMTVCAGVIALATISLLSNGSLAQAREAIDANGEQAQTTAAINIARVKNVLKLTPAQEPYWAPVEEALRDLARQQVPADSAGLMRRISHRVVSVVLNSAAVQRLAVAARPLVAMLNEEQMRAAHGLAREMGLGPVVAALK